MSKAVKPIARTDQPSSETSSVFRFSGHETFACRFAWLPKAYRFLTDDAASWSDDDEAIVELGIGKNMVRSLRFWAQAYGIVTPTYKTPSITEFGKLLLSPKGLDPYLERQATPWVLHWKLASNSAIQLFSWFYLFNRWPFPEFTRTEMLRAFRRETERLGFDHSDITLAQHLDALLHTYLPSRSAANLEDSLDGPLVDLNLLKIVGQKRLEGARLENVYALDRSPKTTVSLPLFEFAIDDFWRTRHSQEATITVRELSFGIGSPGRVLLLSEEEVHRRLEEGSRAKSAPFDYLPSAIAGRIVRRTKSDSVTLLRRVYGKA